MPYVGSLHTRLLSTPVPPPLLPYAAKQQPCYHASPPPHNLISPLGHTSRLSRAGPVISTSQVPPPIVPGIPASLPPPPLSPTYGRIVRATKRQRRTCIMRSPAQRLDFRQEIGPCLLKAIPVFSSGLLELSAVTLCITACPYCTQLSTTVWSS